MFEIIITDVFEDWISALRDDRAVARIRTRLDRLALGNFGDSKTVGGGVSELRIDYGPGYRLYYTLSERVIVVMLCGGDKTTQKLDIKAAQAFAKQWRA